MKYKIFAKRLIGNIFKNNVFSAITNRAKNDHLNIILYHHVGKAAPHNEKLIAESDFLAFKKDMEELSRYYQFVSLNDLIRPDRLNNNNDSPYLSVVFDDGFDLNKFEFNDLFRSLHIPITSFLITGCLDNKMLMWRHKLSAMIVMKEENKVIKSYNELAPKIGIKAVKNIPEILSSSLNWNMSKKDEWVHELWQRCDMLPEKEYLSQWRPYFTWKGLKEWLKSGHSVGFHTHTHPVCSLLDESGIYQEIKSPLQNLCLVLGVKSLPFAYPFGIPLNKEKEKDLYQDGMITRFFGIRGLSRKGTESLLIERADAETCGIGWTLFAEPILNKIF